MKKKMHLRCSSYDVAGGGVDDAIDVDDNYGAVVAVVDDVGDEEDEVDEDEIGVDENKVACAAGVADDVAAFEEDVVVAVVVAVVAGAGTRDR